MYRYCGTMIKLNESEIKIIRLIDWEAGWQERLEGRYQDVFTGPSTAKVLRGIIDAIKDGMHRDGSNVTRVNGKVVTR